MWPIAQTSRIRRTGDVTLPRGESLLHLLGTRISSDDGVGGMRPTHRRRPTSARGRPVGVVGDVVVGPGTILVL